MPLSIIMIVEDSPSSRELVISQLTVKGRLHVNNNQRTQQVEHLFQDTDGTTLQRLPSASGRATAKILTSSGLQRGLFLPPSGCRRRTGCQEGGLP